MTDLSYGWTKRGLTTNSQSMNLVAGDKARVVSGDDSALATGGAGKHKDNSIGNHKDCMLVVCVDAHTQRLTPNADVGVNTANVAATTASPPGGFLGVLQDDEAASN